MDFRILSTSELLNYIKTFRWTRRVIQLHIHHTWKPDHGDYTGSNGIALQNAIRSYHVNNKGWRDIAQHLTLLPDGQWVTGRDFNTDPASIQGWNEGAFCIEMLGNFDTGCNKFEGKQLYAMLEFCAFFVTHMELDVEAVVRFHRDHPKAGKTCPGSSIDKAWFIKELNTKIRGQSKFDETWKYKAIDELASSGFLNEPDQWKTKINEPMPVWAVLAIINLIRQELSKDQ